MTKPDTLHITVRLYSVLRHREGGITDRLELELPPGSRSRDVLKVLGVSRELEVVLALNNKVVVDNVPLQDGDQLAIIPAVSGG